MISFQAAPTDLSGKTCVVTGASGGIDLSVTEHFLALGAQALAKETSDARAVADLLGTFGDHLDDQPINFTDTAGMTACCDWITAARSNVQFNNAAIIDMGDVLEADISQCDRIFNLNACAMHQVMQTTAQTLSVDGGNVLR